MANQTNWYSKTETRYIQHYIVVYNNTYVYQTQVVTID